MNVENRGRAQSHRESRPPIRGRNGRLNIWLWASKKLFGQSHTTQLQTNREPIASNPIQHSSSNTSLTKADNVFSPELMTSTLDVLHCPVVVVGSRNRVIHANAEAIELFGQNIVGRNFALMLRDQKALKALSDVSSKGGKQSLEMSVNESLTRQYNVTITRLPNILGTPHNVAIEFQENTLFKRTESMRSEFVANVSHELRSPLATLIGFIETIQTGTANGNHMEAVAQARFLGIMEAEAQRMSRMIDDLLSLTDVELHEHDRPIVRVNLQVLLREVIDALFTRGQQSSVEINLLCSANLPDIVGDRDQLIQVFNNLITNAIKYGANGKKVDVTTSVISAPLSSHDNHVRIQVKDYGEGIEKNHLPRLTDRFYRVDKGRSRAVGGTGLGLAIVKHIVNRHRGQFQIESVVGEGSTFAVTLPIYKDAPLKLSSS